MNVRMQSFTKHFLTIVRPSFSVKSDAFITLEQRRPVTPGGSATHLRPTATAVVECNRRHVSQIVVSAFKGSAEQGLL